MPYTRHRSRTNVLFPPTEGTRVQGYGNTVVFKATGLQSTSDSETLFKYFRERKLLRRHDFGTDFYSRSPYFEGGDNVCHAKCFGYEYHGPAWIPGYNPIITDPWFTDLENNYGASSVVTQMIAAGATGISSSWPNNPASELATTLGELRNEGLPKVTGSIIAKGSRGTKRSGAKGKTKDASSEYLNYQFGVKPLISDMEKFVNTTSDLEKIVRKFVNDSGKPIRRRREFPEKTEKLQSHQFSGHPPYLTTPWLYTGSTPGSLGTVTQVITRKSKSWFSGSFTYHVPDGDRLIDKIRASEASLHRSYGSITANTAWNLLPWSWAVDWTSNMGDVINNVTLMSRDGMVMNYGYIMRRDELRVEHVHTGFRFGSDTTVLKPYPGVNRMAYGVTTKRRMRATPFGFGITTESFTLRQNAIIAALGLNRLSR